MAIKILTKFNKSQFMRTDLLFEADGDRESPIAAPLSDAGPGGVAQIPTA